MKTDAIVSQGFAYDVWGIWHDTELFWDCNVGDTNQRIALYNRFGIHAIFYSHIIVQSELSH